MTPESRLKDLTPTEWRVYWILAQRSPMSVAEVSQDLARFDDRSSAETTVRTLLTRLETKGYLCKATTEPLAYRAAVPLEVALKFHITNFLDQYAMDSETLEVVRMIVEARLEMSTHAYDSRRLLSRIQIEPPSRMVLRGTSVTVDNLLERLASGRSTEDILAEYTDLCREDVQAAIAYARLALTSARLAF